MSQAIIYHNPGCSKSRSALEILHKELGSEAIIEVRYMKEVPTIEVLSKLCRGLKVHPLEIIRSGEQRFKELGLTNAEQKSEAEWLAILHQNPQLIERPIVCYRDKAVIARPPEKVFEIL